MKITTKITALLVAFSLLFASNASARTAAPQPDDDEPSTTEKVIGALAVGAIAGVAYWALTDDDDHHRRGYYRDRRDYRGHRRGYEYNHRRGHYRGPRVSTYVAFNNGFSSFAIGYPGHRPHRELRPYWYRHDNIRFYRVPYRYNQRYDQAFNAGWERGYWAGYMQGRHDARNRGHCREQFRKYGNDRLWGYDRRMGDYRSYSRAFESSYEAGYLHAYNGRDYGCENFGYGGNMRSYGRDYYDEPYEYDRRDYDHRRGHQRRGHDRRY
jgi:hypothetical protein